jgi:AraC-like DNA-binding protein
MFTPFVTNEKPVALYEGIPPQYSSEGMAIDCALILHVLEGTARVQCNFETIEERPGSVVLFNQGDIIKIERRSRDFKVEIVAVSGFLQLAALNQLEDVNINTLKRLLILDSPELSAAASGMVTMLRSALTVSAPRQLYFIAVSQLRAFYSLFHVVLNNTQPTDGSFKNRGDELFYRFRGLLSRHYRHARNVAFYADKLGITPRYLGDIVQSRYGTSPKRAIDTFVVMQLRLELLQSDISLTELAFKYDFSSLSFFSDYFTRNAGCTPQQYRIENA